MSQFHEVDHLSYSSLSTYTSCPRSYYLSRHKKAWGAPAWYFIVGTAVHEWIHDSLVGTPPRPIEEYFDAEVARALEIEEDQTAWLHGGSEDDPVVGERALRLARECVDRAGEFIQDTEVWHSELDVSGFLPGCTLPVKAYVDIFGEHKKHGPVILDWKTGTTKPKDNLQLETYNCLSKGRVRDAEFKGLWAMLNPKAAKARPVTFKHTPESLGKLYGSIEQRIRDRIWNPEPQFNCKFCTMKPNCRTMSGNTERTRYYDTPNKDKGFPF